MTSSAIFNTILITVLAVLAVRGLMLTGDKERAPHCLPEPFGKIAKPVTYSAPPLVQEKYIL